MLKRRPSKEDQLKPNLQHAAIQSMLTFLPFHTDKCSAMGLLSVHVTCLRKTYWVLILPSCLAFAAFEQATARLPTVPGDSNAAEDCHRLTD